MNGTFMDGGGHDHGGHAMHGGGGDGGGFMDGGNHDHGHHGHAMHGSGGDGGGFLNHILGYNNDGGHHSFLSHLLGLDHDAHHHGGHHDGGHGGEGVQNAGQNPSQTPIWTSALQGMKLSHALEGVNISLNAWFFIFYMICIFWLFLVYWIRHHEPLANAVLGRGAAKYETAAQDRRIIDNCRDATPIRTSQSQAYYAPMPKEFHDPNAQRAITAAAFNPATANQPYFSPAAVTPNMTPQTGLNGSPVAPTGLIPGAMTSSAIPAAPSAFMPATPAIVATPSGAGTADMASFYNQTSPFGAPIGAGNSTLPAAIANANGPAHLIATPAPLLPGAQRLKMIINR